MFVCMCVRFLFVFVGNDISKVMVEIGWITHFRIASVDDSWFGFRYTWYNLSIELDIAPPVPVQFARTRSFICVVNIHQSISTCMDMMVDVFVFLSPCMRNMYSIWMGKFLWILPRETLFFAFRTPQIYKRKRIKRG